MAGRDDELKLDTVPRCMAEQLLERRPPFSRYVLLGVFILCFLAAAYGIYLCFVEGDTSPLLWAFILFGMSMLGAAGTIMFPHNLSICLFLFPLIALVMLVLPGYWAKMVPLVFGLGLVYFLFFKTFRFLVVFETEKGRFFYYTVSSGKGPKRALELAKENHLKERPEEKLIRVKEVSSIQPAGMRGYDILDSDELR